MFGYSMIQTVRSHSKKMDHPLRRELLNMYRPFKRIPCFLHKWIEGGYKRFKKYSVIIEFEEGYYDAGCDELNSIIARHSRSELNHHFPNISCVSAEVTPNCLEETLSTCSEVKKIYYNREVRALLDVATPSANAHNIMRNGVTLTGVGTKIAIVDTGIYPHTDLEGRITDFKDFINDRTDPYDDNGHGTHCAGDAAGNGFASSGQYQGPAPNANLVGVKVLDKMGAGSLETVMQGVNWCIEYNEENPEDPIDIMSMSLGSTALNYGDDKDPMVMIVEAAWESGITVVVAAGNEGPDSYTIASPGVSNRVITIGAFDDNNTANTRTDDQVAIFSSRGPTIYGDTKPDLLAPGVNIVSLRSPRSYLDKLQKSARVGDDYIVMSGTSMATPICAGIVALMKEHEPTLTPDIIKQRLMEGTVLWRNQDPNIYGAGYINAENSIP